MVKLVRKLVTSLQLGLLNFLASAMGLIRKTEKDQKVVDKSNLFRYYICAGRSKEFGSSLNEQKRK
jgi:hypothetical protein